VSPNEDTEPPIKIRNVSNLLKGHCKRYYEEDWYEMTRRNDVSDEMRCRKAKKRALKRLFGLAMSVQA
jgi:hypothetical protein